MVGPLLFVNNGSNVLGPLPWAITRVPPRFILATGMAVGAAAAGWVAAAGALVAADGAVVAAAEAAGLVGTAVGAGAAHPTRKLRITSVVINSQILDRILFFSKH